MFKYNGVHSVIQYVYSTYCAFYTLSLFFNDTATSEIYTYLHTLSLHDALPICASPTRANGRTRNARCGWRSKPPAASVSCPRSEEHTSELQSLMRNSYYVFCLKQKTNYKLYM